MIGLCGCRARPSVFDGSERGSAAGGWLGATMPATMMLRWALATAVLLGTATAAAPRPHFVFLLIDGACGVTHLSLLPDINSPRRRY